LDFSGLESESGSQAKLKRTKCVILSAAKSKDLHSFMFTTMQMEVQDVVYTTASSAKGATRY